VSTLDGALVHQQVADGGRPTKVVTRVDGSRFADVWLETVTAR
jgi:hypothetical protein